MTALWLLILCVLWASAEQSSALQQSAEPSPVDLRVGFARSHGGYAVETIPLETYVARVLAGEAARDSSPAALEALAVTIRTYALVNRDRHRADGFDVCDQTHCQVVRAATSATIRAVQATAGEVLTRNGELAAVFYSASCGGRTEIPSNVWPGADDPSHLPIADDDACRGEPTWEAELQAADLLRAFRAAGFRGSRIRDLRVVSRNRSGRVARLRIDGLTPSDISGQDLRVVVGSTLGWQHIKSASFELRRRGASYRFAGRGFGHGVGLCVIGSTNLAARGASASAILAKYFPGAAIGQAGQAIARRLRRDAESAAVGLRGSPPSPVAGAVLVALPDGDAGERRAIEQLTIRARDDLAEALGVQAPALLTLRIHPTADDYERATGHAWFTSGAWVGQELHLLPLAALRQRGLLERTIRHELVHALTAGVLGTRPAWVQEGAAVYFADRPGSEGLPGSARPQSPGRAACPRDSELQFPVTVGALADAYARARACFARQIDDGRDWREVR